MPYVAPAGSPSVAVPKEGRIGRWEFLPVSAGVKGGNQLPGTQCDGPQPGLAQVQPFLEQVLL